MYKRVILPLIFIMAFTTVAVDSEPLPMSPPGLSGLNEEFINHAFDEVNIACISGAAPGAVGLVMKDGKIIARRAIGFQQVQTAIPPTSATCAVEYQPLLFPMREDTIFDLASLTKAVVTTTSIMILVDQRKLNLDRPVAKYIPRFGAHGKEKITVRHLLTHTSGLPAWASLYASCVSMEEAARMIDEEIILDNPPGVRRVYSDLGFIMLGRLVEEVSGLRLDKFAEKYIFAPLELYNTQYLPLFHLRGKIAPTEYDPLRRTILQGIVHDENARELGGISGHAGLFSTADDLAVFAQMLLSEGVFKGKRILSKKSIQEMLKPQLEQKLIEHGSGFLQSRQQLLGWWGMDTRATINQNGGLPSKTAFGHSGFTGTMIYVDPEHNAAAILLTNAVHPLREYADKRRLYYQFYANVSKALVGEKYVNIETLK